jgi:hypothetical protein
MDKQQNVKEVDAEWKILQPKFEELTSVRRHRRSSYLTFPSLSLHITAEVLEFELAEAKIDPKWEVRRTRWSSGRPVVDFLFLRMGEKLITLKVPGQARIILTKKEGA